MVRPTRLRSCARVQSAPRASEGARLDARLCILGSRGGSSGGGGLGEDAGGSRATRARRLPLSVESAPSVPGRVPGAIRPRLGDSVGDRAVRRRRGERRGAGATRVAGGRARAQARAVRGVSRHELERLRGVHGPRQNGAAAPRRSPGAAELLQDLRGPRAVSVRRVLGDGRGEQLAVRPDGEPGVGPEGAVARPGPTAADEEMIRRLVVP